MIVEKSLGQQATNARSLNLNLRRKGRIAFLMMDRLVVFDKPNPSKKDGGASVKPGPEDGRHEEDDSEVIIQNRRKGKL